MFAVVAAILFAIALIMELAKLSGNSVLNDHTLITAGLLFVALHLAGAWTWVGRRRR